MEYLYGLYLEYYTLMKFRYILYTVCLLLQYNCSNDNNVVYYTSLYDENYYNDIDTQCNYYINLSSYLYQDENDYYHMEFLFDYIQTFTTLSAETGSYQINQKVKFISNKEIYLNGEWINVINSDSYTDETGYAYGVVGIWEQFIGDTIKIYTGFIDECQIHHIDSLQIIVN